LANLAKAISFGENPKELIEIAETAIQVGHTSGMDALTGLLVSLTTWSKPGLAETLHLRSLD
jgi:hypothetical protein